MSDRTKLPKWAQKEIESLETRLHHATVALMQFQNDQEKTPVYIERVWSIKEGGPAFGYQYLNTREVTFNLGKEGDESREKNISIRLSTDHNDEPELVVAAGWSTLSIRPSCANVVKIKADR